MTNYITHIPQIIPAYWLSEPNLDSSFVESLKIFYDRVSFDESDNPPRIYGEDIDVILQKAASYTDYTWVVVIGVGTVFASQLKIAKETVNFINSIKEPVLACGHLIDKPGYYCGLHEQFFIVNLDNYRKLNQPRFGNYGVGTHFLNKYSAGPSVHDNYTPTFLTPEKGTDEYRINTCGWGLVNASLAAGMRLLNLPNSVRECKVFVYPSDETEKLNRNIQRFNQWEHLKNVSQRAVFAHLMLKKLELTASDQKGSFGFKSRSNCLFFFNTQKLIPDGYENVRLDGPLDQYSGPCSGFQDLAFLKAYGFHDDTELVYFDINPLALEMKQFVLENFDGRISSIQPLVKKLEEIYEGEEIFYGNLYYSIKELVDAFDGDENALRQTWLKMQKLKRKFIKMNLLTETDLIFEHLRPEARIVLNLTDIFLGQNELLYGHQGVTQMFLDLIVVARKFPELILTGTSTNQVLFVDKAVNLDPKKL